jgi:YfiR/HmsC-like
MFTKQSIQNALYVLLLVLVVAPGRIRAESREYQIKAAFLFNFAQFVQWPSAAYTNAAEPFCIGVLGDNPFGPALEETIQGESIGGHKLMVRHSRRVEDLQNCQMIFISKSEHTQVPQILSTLDSRPILTVSETDRFAQEGGIINLYLVGDKVRFEINPDVAKRDGLKISSQLLSLGKIVGTAKKEE